MSTSESVSSCCVSQVPLPVDHGMVTYVEGGKDAAKRVVGKLDRGAVAMVEGTIRAFD